MNLAHDEIRCQQRVAAAIAKVPSKKKEFKGIWKKEQKQQEQEQQ